MGKQLDDTAVQAGTFARYLIGHMPHAHAIILFTEAMADVSAPISTHDKKLLAFILKHPWAIGPIDGALALLRPQSEVRRRIYIMFSILEARPEYTEHFLPRRSTWWSWLFMMYTGVIAVLKTIIGIVLVKVVVR